MERQKTDSTSKADVGPRKDAATTEFVTGNDLLKMTFTDPPWLVPDFLPIGLCVFGGKPKAGKSILVNNLAFSVATGGRFFGHRMDKATVLLLALEDSPKRLQSRLLSMCCNRNEVDLSGLIIRHQLPKSNQGGLDELRMMVNHHQAKLVIIDTMKKIKPSVNGKKQLYDEDYEVVDGLKTVADEFKLTMILVHHLRKMDAEDPFDTFSGSLGLTAPADTLWVMRRKSNTMLFSGKGRDFEEFEKAIELDPSIMTWGVLGDADEIQSSRQQQMIFNALKNSDVPLKPKEINGLCDGISYDVVRQLLKKMVFSGRIMVNSNREYCIKKNNNKIF